MDKFRGELSQQAVRDSRNWASAENAKRGWNAVYMGRTLISFHSPLEDSGHMRAPRGPLEWVEAIRRSMDLLAVVLRKLVGPTSRLKHAPSNVNMTADGSHCARGRNLWPHRIRNILARRAEPPAPVSPFHRVLENQ